LRKNPDVEQFQNYLCQRLVMSDLYQIRDIASKVQAQVVDMIFYLRNHFTNRDVSNLVKISEDALVRATGVDDSKTIKFIASKLRSESNNESICITVALTI